MRTANISLILAGLSLTAGLAACGTPAPSPNNTGNTKSGAAAPGKTGGKAGTGTTTSGQTGKAGSGKAAFSGSTNHKANAGSTGAKATKSGSSATAKNSTGKTKTTTGGKTQGANTGGKTGSATKSGTAAAPAPISLTSLPTMGALDKFNPHMGAYHEVSTFINNMGYHWATAVPGMVFMTNQHNQITAVEAQFPQNHGDYSWYDPATPPSILNASLAFYSEHLYFVPDTSITPSMSAIEPTSLTSWSAFVSNNPRLKAYTKDGSYRGYTVYGPPTGPGIEVLVSPHGLVSGFRVAEPYWWGQRPVYVSNGGAPFANKTWGKAYYSVLMLEPPNATARKAGT